MKLITVKELSGLIEVKRSTLYEWVNRGIIPSYKLNGLIRFDMDEIKEWIKRSKFTPYTPKKASKKATPCQDIDIIIKKAIEDVKSGRK